MKVQQTQCEVKKKKDKKEPIIYACDFETVAPILEDLDYTYPTNKRDRELMLRERRNNLREEGTRVWIGGVMNINDSTYQYIPFVDTEKESLDNFMEFVFNSPSRSVFYFHNLKFDGQFIACWLLNNGFTNIEIDKRITPNCFSAMVDDLGSWYSITVNKGKKIFTFRDSLKLIPSTIKQMAKDFGLEVSKGEIEYRGEKDFPYKPTAEEIDYHKRDIEILAKCLKIMKDNGYDSITTSACALNEYKRILCGFTKEKYKECKNAKKICNNYFLSVFPKLTPEEDSYIRKSYFGGISWVNPNIINKEIVPKYNGIVLDRKSMHPSNMYYELLPYGRPVYYEGKYQEDKTYNLYIQQIFVKFTWKKNKIPFLHGAGNFASNSNFMLESAPEGSYLTLTNIDLELFLQSADIEFIDYIDGVKFMSSRNLFKPYIDYYYSMKENNKGSLKAIAKLMLNGLYGKFATTQKSRLLKLYIDQDSTTLMGETYESEKDLIYLPVATFVTSYSHKSIKDNFDSLFDKLMYVDTDSAHLVDVTFRDLKHVTLGKKLGNYWFEEFFTRARYLKPKTYYEVDERRGLKYLKSAGLSKDKRDTVEFKDFYAGAVVKNGCLKSFKVKNGVILLEQDFTF